MNSWRNFFNSPKCVFGLIATLVVTWLLFHPQMIADFVNNVVMPLLMQALVIGIMIWGIKIMIFGGPRKKGK